MQWFYNLKTVGKLILGFSLVCAIMAVVGYVGLAGMSKTNEALGTMYERDLMGVSYAKEANLSVMFIAREMRDAIIAKDKTSVATNRKNAEKYAAMLNGNVDDCEKTITTEDGRRSIAALREAVPVYLKLVQRVLDLCEANQSDAAITELKGAKGTIVAVVDTASSLAKTKQEYAEQRRSQAEARYITARNTLFAVVGGGIALAMVLGYGIARMIARPLALAVEVCDAVARGDFTQSLDVSTKDEVGRMASALNEAVASMRTSLQEARSVADGVASAAQQLAAASESISSGAQEQASSLEETASSLEEITSTISQNADNAQQANQLAAGARDVAEKGGHVATDAVKGMAEINTASKKIADIITAIDEIAFQTNLLALNAAVEAARAGEQGRGFAVVAGEVRNLAQRSAGAAKEIKGLIQDSVRKVEQGSALVNQSGKSLEDIVSSVKRVTDIVSEIAAASREQASGIEQVNKAVTQMDQVTQSNASQTEELSGTAEGLAAQAGQLQAMVARFKLEQGARRPETPASTAPARTAAPVKRVAAKSRAKTARAKPQTTACRELRQSVEEETHELELVGAGVGDGAHGGFEEF